MTSISPLFSMYTTQGLHNKVCELRMEASQSAEDLADFIESELHKGEIGLLEKVYD